MTHDDLTPEQRATRGALWRESLDTLPRRLVEHVVERLARWAIPLSPEGLRLPRRAAECDLVHTASDVLAYARTGRAGDWDDDGSAMDALQSLSIVYESPLGDPEVPADWADGAELEGLRAELAEVARATLARVHLARGETIPRPWLAALAGVSVSTIEKAIRLDELATSKRRRARGDGGGKPAVDVDNASARAWLAARSVEGV